MLSFAAVWFEVNRREWVEAFGSWGYLVSAVCGVLLWADLGPKAEYVLDPLLMAVGFLGLLVALVNRPWRHWAVFDVTGWIARISYSVYLTHALVIHALVRLLVPPEGWYELPVLAIYVGVILLVGWLFYLVFERSAFIWRERLVPAGGRGAKIGR